MKLTRSKTDIIRSALTAFLAVFLCFGNAFAEEETSDFERLIRQAIQQDQEKSQAAEAAKTKSAPKVAAVPKTGEVKQDKSITKLETVQAFETSRAGRVVPKQVDAGWTVLVPNDAKVKTPDNVALKKTVTIEKAGIETSKNDGTSKAGQLLVADQRMSVAVEAGTESKDDGVSLWNAVPENVTLPGESVAEPGVKAPWSSVKITVETAASVREPAVEAVAESAKGTETVETDMHEDEVSKEPLETKETVETNEAPKAETETADEPVKTETEPIVVTTEEQAEEKEEEPRKETGRKPAEKAAEKSIEEKAEAMKSAEPAVEEKTLAETKEKAAEEKAGETVIEKTEEQEPTAPAKIIVREIPEPTLPDFDDDDDDSPKAVLINGKNIGDAHAKDKLKLMYDEIVNGLKTRNVSGRYEMWKNYARNTLRSTSGLQTGSEVDGRARLSWYQQLYSEPVFSVFAAEEFSRQIHQGLSGNHRYLAEAMGMIRKKLDVAGRNDDGIRFPLCETPIDAVNEVKRCLIEAQMAYSRALSTLSTAEKNDLVTNLVPTFSGQGCINGHTIPNRSVGRRLINIMEKMDRTGIHDAAEALIPLTNLSLLALLDKLPENAFPKAYIGGQEVQRLSTSAGDIIIGGRENNIYDLDSPEMRDVVCVIDLGGDDVYREGTCNVNRPILAIIDLHGNDKYMGSKPGIQGGSVLGVSILIDVEGNDSYAAGDVAQGSTLGGAGMLFDFGGNDEFKGLRRVQGHALGGVGVLVNREGNNKYRAALWAQGFGAPAGFGVLNDVKGDDHYYCGGLYLDSYPEHPGYDGWGQGIGAGIRQSANGGIGMILDGAGDDVYEVDYFGHGGGYWLGVGIARDFGGNDIRHGTTLNAYNGGPRTQSKWTRFANGFGCHYACGYLFDDAGNDVYGGTIMGTGMAWDLALGYLCDFNGSDRFTATGGMTQGVGAEGSIGILFSYGGNDVYSGRNQAYASGGITYHSPSNCGSNFSFLINYGGNDQYGCGAKNNSYVQRGTSGGFLIDRPTDREAADDLIALQKQIEEREKEIAEFEAVQTKAREEAAANGRRYVPPRRRPVPISQDQRNRVGSVPHFDSPAARTGGNEVNVK